MKHSFTKEERKTLAFSRRLSILIYGIFIAVGTICGLLFFARPTTSSLEKRDLTPFPTITLSSFLDGSWFSQISCWYSDTYPGREQLLALNNEFSKWEGIQTQEQVIGGGKADDLSQELAKEEKKEEETQFDTRKSLPDNNILAQDIQGQITEGLLIKDGAAYSGYYFNEDSYKTYTQAIERAAKKLEGKTNVYSILVPNNSGVDLDEETRGKLGGTDQKQAIDYYYSNYSDLVKPVGTIDTLLEHRQEDLYFGSDHHWKPLAAYYVYQNFCKAKGIDPIDKGELETIHYTPFLGSYASQLPHVDFVEDNMDVWIPKSTNTLKVIDDPSCNINNESFYEHPIVNTDEGIDIYNQYMRLIGGDQPFEVIDNPNIEDGTSCLVVKESYGNAFVPWLVDHYDKVYVMDFRKIDVPIAQWCLDNQVTDLILINNIQLAASASVANTYDYLLQ